MEEKKELINTDRLEQITIKRIIDGITGFTTGSKEDYAHTANRLLKSLFANDFLFQVQKEWDLYCVKGKIDLEYTNSQPYLTSLTELVDYLDTDIPNEEIAKTLKKLFFIPAFKENKKDRLLAYEYMKIVRKLAVGELTVLFTTYDCIYLKQKRTNWSAAEWLEIIAEKSNLRFIELVALNETKLIELHLITKRLLQDGSGITIGDNFRLTDLGYNLCKYIELYEE